MEFTKFNLPIFLLIISIVGFIFFLVCRFYFNQIKFNKNFKLLSSNKYFYIKYIFLIFSLFIIFLAIFGLKYGEKKMQNENKGIDIMFVLDVSKSMNVADILDSNSAYTRLDVIKDSISKFIVSHKEDRFGLIIFAGDAVLTIPLTTDHDLFLTFLKGVDYRNLTKQGTNFEKAFSLGIDRFSNNNDNERGKFLIFISDGGELEDNINKDNIKQIKNSFKGITYSVVGVGTSIGGKIIIGKDVWGRYSYQQYEGEYVISKINRSNLKDIATNLDGDYIEVNKVGDLSFLNKNINKLEKKIIMNHVNGEPGDLGRFLAITSFIFFIIFIVLYLIEDKIIFIKNNNE